MKNLIEYPVLREMKIIQTLVVEKEFLTDHEIVLLNNCSIATARNDIEMIYNKYQDVFDVAINSHKIEFKNKSVSTLREVMRELFDQSITIQILLNVFYEPGKSRQYHCDYSGISEASFYRIVNDINSGLNDAKFAIVFRSKGYYLQANNELELRRFMVSLLIEAKKSDEAFKEIPFETLYEILYKHTLKELPYKYEMQFYYYTFYAYVTLLRESQGFTTEIDSVDNLYIEEYSLLKGFFPSLNPSHLIVLRQTLLAQIYPWKSESEKQRMHFAFEYFIDDIKKRNKHICTQDMHDQLMFISHCTLARHNFFPEPYILMFDRTEIFSSLFAIKNPSYYKEFFDSLQYTSHILNKDLESIGNQLLFWFHMICPSLYLSPQQPQVRIVSDIGKEHELFLKDVFSSLFLSINILDDKDDTIADFIISNYTIEESDSQVIYIRDYPLKEDLLLIYDQIQQVYSGK